MFYVIYDPHTKQYMNDEGSLGGYGGATKFERFTDAECAVSVAPCLRVVGPCIKGEAP
jgi:hypothetical protein